MINGLFETHISVTHLERSMQFYGERLGLELGRFEAERRVAFYWLGKRGEAMLGVWEAVPDKVLRQHFAFRTTLEAMKNAGAYFKGRNLVCRNFFDDQTDKPTVFGWMPAVALYFKDPDGHSLEFIAMLPGEPRPDIGIVSWEAWDRLSADPRLR